MITRKRTPSRQIFRWLLPSRRPTWIGFGALASAAAATLAIAVGVGVDYATHFTMRFIEEFEHEPSRFPALRRAGEGTGGALAISAFPFTSGFVTKSLETQAAANEGMLLVWLLLLAASAGVFLHAGIKFPWFVFFQKDSGLRPPDPPLNIARRWIASSRRSAGHPDRRATEVNSRSTAPWWWLWSRVPWWWSFRFRKRVQSRSMEPRSSSWSPERRS